jgi:hypothetical protein
VVGPVLMAMAVLLSPHQLHVKHYDHEIHMLYMAQVSHGYTLTTQDNDGDHDADDGYSVPQTPVYAPQSHVQASGGTLGCAGLERLWESAGGSYGAAFTAAEIAMAESGGNQYATGAAGERGYWQINPVNGSLSTYDAYGNARAAIVLSGNGVNWTPWTTYTSGAYIGRCLYGLVGYYHG